MDRRICLAVAVALAGMMDAQPAAAGTWITCSSTPGGKVTVGDMTFQEPDIQNCDVFNDGMGDWTPPDWSYGGGGGAPALDETDRPISSKLECALNAYTDPAAKPGAGQTMKKVSAYAFGKPNASGDFGYRIMPTNTPPPGGGWSPVAGITAPGTAYGRLYNAAFTGSSNYNVSGTRAGYSSNSLSGALSDFEKSLYVAAHESSHLRGNAGNESLANWHGIQAVQAYRRDGGAKCAGK